MMIRFHPQAERELREAVAWYGRQRLGLDIEFMRCIDEAIMRILKKSKSFSHRLRQARKELAKRFTDILYFEANKEETWILAVFNTKHHLWAWRYRDDA